MNIRWSSQSFPSDSTAGVSSRSFTDKNKSISLTKTVGSSFVCTSPLAVITVVGLFEVVTVSNSAEFKSFLLIMCIDAPESTTNSLSSSSIFDGEGRHHFSVSEKKVDSCFSFSFRIFFASLHAASRAHRSCHSVSSWDRSSNFGALGFRCWGSPGQIIPSDGFWSRVMAWRNAAFGELNTSDWLQVFLRSSVKSMKISAAPYPEIYNPIVVYPST